MARTERTRVEFPDLGSSAVLLRSERDVGCSGRCWLHRWKHAERKARRAREKVQVQRELRRDVW